MEEGNEQPGGDTPLDIAVRTRRFALAVIKLAPKIPRGDVGDVIRKQIIRSATSVGAQYREGRRGRSDAEYISKLEGSLQELDETGYWLELLDDAHLVDHAIAARYLGEVEELIRILVQCIKTAKGKE